jgi:hypothetical protein
VLIVKSANDCVLVGTGCVVVCIVVCTIDATVNVMLFTLLLGFGSSFVETDQVNVCVPGVAIHGVCALTINRVPFGPG